MEIVSEVWEYNEDQNLTNNITSPQEVFLGPLVLSRNMSA